MITAEAPAAIELFESAFGAPWRRGPIPTALDVLEADLKRVGAWQSPRTLPPPALQGGTETPLLWTRELRRDELARHWVVQVDKRAAYLGVLGGLELGIGNPQRDDWPAVMCWLGFGHHGRPGYWRVSCEFPPPDPDFPDPFDRDRAKARRGQSFWITTPTLELAVEAGLHVLVHESWTWPAHKRVLRPFGERCTAARHVLDQERQSGNGAAVEALRTLKHVYAPVLGGFLARREDQAREHRPPWFRPDWRHHIIAKARANLWRNMARWRPYGWEPIGVYNDAAYYAVDDFQGPTPVFGDGFTTSARVLRDVVKDGRLSWPLLFARP